MSNKKLRLRWLHRWHQIKARCTDPDHPRFHRYGGRGIKLHRTFRTFPGFMAHVKTLRGWSVPEARQARRCLDRKDNDKGYQPGNLRMTSYRVNRMNRSEP